MGSRQREFGRVGQMTADAAQRISTLFTSVALVFDVALFSPLEHGGSDAEESSVKVEDFVDNIARPIVRIAP